MAAISGPARLWRVDMEVGRPYRSVRLSSVRDNTLLPLAEPLATLNDKSVFTIRRPPPTATTRVPANCTPQHEWRDVRLRKRPMGDTDMVNPAGEVQRLGPRPAAALPNCGKWESWMFLVERVVKGEELT